MILKENCVIVPQVIMVRLQRVTFTALHNYLGLSSELINRVGHSSRLGIIRVWLSHNAVWLNNTIVFSTVCFSLFTAVYIQKARFYDQLPLNRKDSIVTQ